MHQIEPGTSISTIKDQDEDLLNKKFNSYTDKFKNKEDLLRAYIGKRESHNIEIESYNFNNKTNHKDHHHHKHSKMSSTNNNTNNINQHGFVTNAMTMQNALETAYMDWNKDKSRHDNPSLNELDSITKVAENMIIEDSNEIRSVIKNDDNNDSSILTSKRDKKTSENESSKSSVLTNEVPFYYGNPTVDIIKGFIHIYKDWCVFFEY